VRAVAIVAIALLVAGCAHDGRTLRAPPPGAVSPPLPTTTVAGQTTAVRALALSSVSFEPGGPLPIEFTCDGAGVSPPLEWGSVPEGTVELVLTVTDSDANQFVHWVLTGLDPSTQALAVGVVPDDAVEAKNTKGTVGWTGPCPPRGGGSHHYVFTLYALTASTGITEDMSGSDAIAAISQIPGLTATLLGTYERAQ
jgi:Raf kinase inhibitor-like YbhB/YbcL family protein